METLTFLLVDDSATMRRILRNVADEFGAEAVEAVDGDEAVARAAECGADLDLILLDWNMPNMNGLEALQRIKADEATRDTPVVMVTTEAEKSSVILAIKAGACQYVTKPFTPDTLREKINKALGRS